MTASRKRKRVKAPHEHVGPLSSMCPACTDAPVVNEEPKIRVISAWMVLTGSTIRPSHVYYRKRVAESDAVFGDRVVPCTITYTEPPKPKRKARR